MIRAVWEDTVSSRLWRTTKRLVLQRMSHIGDQLFLTAVAREVQRTLPETRIEVVCGNPELFSGNPRFASVREHAQVRDLPFIVRANYERVFERDPRDPRHIAEILCDQIGVACEDTRPELYLSDAERSHAGALRERWGRYVTLHAEPSQWTPNKTWPREHWEALTAQLHQKEIRLIEIRSEHAKPLPHSESFVVGGNPLRSLFPVLAGARAHVGVVSFPMHAAAALSTPSVVVYGGYEPISASSYPGNRSLASRVDCAPCWLRSPCPHDRKCLREISPLAVAEQLTELIDKDQKIKPV